MDQKTLGPRNPLIPDQSTLENLEYDWNVRNPRLRGVVVLKEKESKFVEQDSFRLKQPIFPNDWIASMWSPIPIFRRLA